MMSSVLTSSGDGDEQGQHPPHHAMAPPLAHGLRVQVLNEAPCDEGETMSLLRSGDSPPASAAAWLSRLENGALPYSSATDKPVHGARRSDQWEVVAALDNGVCCGLRKPRLVEVVQLRHANYGLRWTQKNKKTTKKHHRNPVVRHGVLDCEADDEDDKTDATNGVPFCMVGPHWWLMAATFTVFLAAALTVTVLTVPQAGPGEATMGMLLSIACLSMYAKVGCSNPGIVGHLDEPVDDTYTYCGECESYRPQGALHCMDCRVCIEDYDHHCPWTGKCIGKRNVKYFYAWLFFLVLAFVYEMIEFTTYMLPPEDQPQGFDSEDDDSFYALDKKLSRAPGAAELTVPPSAFRQP